MSVRASRSGCLVVLVCILSIPIPAGAKTIYVDDGASGANDGTSWGDAHFYLQDALMFAVAGDEIRVAQGTYRPDDFVLSDRPSRGRKETFELINGVTLKGGYAGLGEADPNARNVELYETILSGDLDGNDVDVDDPCAMLSDPTRGENSYHVVVAIETDNTAILDGFTITAAHSDRSVPWPYTSTYGGGMYIHEGGPVVSKCTFHANSAPSNYGGGLCISVSRPTLIDCTFSGNAARVGGGIWNSGSQTALIDCAFNGNYATGGGGGMYSSSDYSDTTDDTAILADCTFRGNTADYGGAISGDGFHLSNSQISGNTAGHGGGLDLYGSYDDPAMITDCAITDNIARGDGGGIYIDCGYATISDSIISGNSAGGGGGGLRSYGDTDPSSPTFIGCLIAENSAQETGGGFSGDFNSNPTFKSCLVVANRAEKGGGMYIGGWTESVLTNCTFSGNLARTEGGAVYSNGDGYDTLTVGNSILWGDMPDEAHLSGVSVFQEYNNIQGGWPDEDDVSFDPCFVNPGYWDPNGTVDDSNDDFWVDGDYHLKSQGGRYDGNEGRWMRDEVTSPCIDAGDPMTPVGLELFPNGGIVNMGAYGGTTEASKSYFGKAPCEVIVAGDVNGDCVVDFRDFRIMALHWMWEDSEGMD